MSRASSQNLTLVLGPTNTGKTHLALERMTGYASGMVGFPLRLLARENYDRLVARLGSEKVGLLTGEERILPDTARYLCCTVESMPVETSQLDDLAGRRFDFVAVDEVQLAGDRERGHIFTDRILHARGAFETMFMGAKTAAPLLKALLPDARFEFRERMSRLVYAGPKKLTRLPRRSAVVAFSTSDVYQIAEFVRRQRGGAAVVMGRLSPRTRNAQVDLYQNGDVDFLIATDAIGMGLNLDLGHVALSADVKFDGRHMRKLAPAEMAQIAGRAGRHVMDGTFGVTDGCRVLEPEVIEAIEQHRFAPLRSFYWRNRALNFGSIELLVESLEEPPPLPFLFRKGDALDHQALVALAARKEVRAAVQGAADVRLLWAVASIPDFRQSLHESHYELLAGVYMALASHGVLAKDTVARAIQQLDRLDGDLDTLMTRLAYIRTWTYITNRSDWTDTPLEWQTRARVIEDKLSDCLHQRLSERFVDKRAVHLSRKLKETKNLIASVKDDGTVLVEGEEVGQLTGFVFNPMLADGEEKAPILASARRGLPDEIERRVQAFVASADAAFQLDDRAVIWWRETAVAQLVKGDSLYVPRAELATSDLLSIDQTQRMQARLVNCLAAHIETVLGRLTILATPDLASQTPAKASFPKDAPVQDSAANEIPAAEPAANSAAQLPADSDQPVDDAATAAADQPVAPAALSGAAKGIAYILFERLGSVPTADIAYLSRNMRETDKPLLARLGLRFGVETVYMPEMLKPAQISLRSLLWSLHAGAFFDGAPPPAGRVAIDSIDDVPDLYWLAIGYRRLGQRVMRVDMVERVAMLVRTAARAGPFKITEDMLSLAGATREAMGMILLDLGCKLVGEEAAEDPTKPVIQIFEKQRKTRAPHNKPQAKTVPGSDGGAAAKKPHGQSRRSKASGAGTRRRPNAASKLADKPNPDSPFAVLAGLKLKG
ncbi:helicase-related protein [Alphaproteobacteria bacterium]|nr:helicase-related protein [Alphaproteobacteria bacterium]MDC1120528.1 helicase-related protein [Alphaproteobacteria bacterium]